MYARLEILENVGSVRSMNSELVMPWGAFKGKMIEELPSSYLKWLSENCDNEEIAQAADEEYMWRDCYPEEHK